MVTFGPHGTVCAVCVRVPWLVRFLLPVAVLGLIGARAAAADNTVLVLRNRAFPSEEARLVEALRIYTRDLDCRIVVAGEAPSPAASDAVDAAARQVRGEGGDLAVWVQKRTDGHLVYELLTMRELDLRETEIARSGAIAAAEAVALKIRTLLSRRPAFADGQEKPREPLPEAVSAAKPLPTPRPALEDAAAKAAALPAPAAPAPRTNEAVIPPLGVEPVPISTASRVAAPGPVTNWLSLGAGYGLVIPRDLAWIRHGLLLSAELRLGDRPLSLVVDTTLTFRAENTTPTNTVSLEDLPFGVGLWRRWAAGRWGVAVGPRASAHVVHVSAVELVERRPGQARRVSAGFGGMARVEVGLRATLKAYGGASLEALLPARDFTVNGIGVLATGPVLGQVSVGLLLAVP